MKVLVLVACLRTEVDLTMEKTCWLGLDLGVVGAVVVASKVFEFLGHLSNRDPEVKRAPVHWS